MLLCEHSCLLAAGLRNDYSAYTLGTYTANKILMQHFGLLGKNILDLKYFLRDTDDLVFDLFNSYTIIS